LIDGDQPERIAASLAAQIEAMFPEQRDAQVKSDGRFPALLGRVSKHLAASERLLVVTRPTRSCSTSLKNRQGVRSWRPSPTSATIGSRSQVHWKAAVIACSYEASATATTSAMATNSASASK